MVTVQGPINSYTIFFPWFAFYSRPAISHSLWMLVTFLSLFDSVSYELPKLLTLLYQSSCILLTPVVMFVLWSIYCSNSCYNICCWGQFLATCYFTLMQLFSHYTLILCLVTALNWKLTYTVKNLLPHCQIAQAICRLTTFCASCLCYTTTSTRLDWGHAFFYMPITRQECSSGSLSILGPWQSGASWRWGFNLDVLIQWELPTDQATQTHCTAPLTVLMK
jgi:hypothetical protein